MPYNLHRLLKPRPAGYLALAGLVIYLVGIGWAIAFFGQRHPQAYSPLNHFVSELSCPALSPMAWMMNASISLGSLLICPMILALGQHVATPLGRIATCMGLAGALAAMLLGTSPMEEITPHLIFALGFFACCLIEMTMITTALWLKYSFGRAPVLLGLGILASLITAGFLVMVTFAAIFLMPPHFNLHQTVADLLAHPDRRPRPRVWPVAVLEWGVVLSIFAWIAASAFYVLRIDRRQEPEGSDCPLTREDHT
jgi:hypothetical protein